jgi:hypothetical protein
MSDQLDQFLAVMHRTLNMVREMRKDTEKLQAKMLAMENFLLSLNPAIRSQLEKEFQTLLKEAEKTIDGQKPPAEKEFDVLLDQVIGMLPPNPKSEN